MAGAREARSCSPPAPSSGRWCSRATTARASCWPAPRAPTLNRYGVLPGTRAVVVTACDEAYGAALDLQQAGVDIALHRRRARRGATAQLRGARARRHRRCCTSAMRARHAGPAARERDRARAHRRRASSAQRQTHAVRPGADVGRLHARACTCSRSRAASSPGTRSCRPSSRARPPSARAAPAPAAASWHSPRRSRMALPPGAPPPRGARSGRAGVDPAGGRGRARRHRCMPARARVRRRPAAQRAGARPRPSSTGRTMSRPRISRSPPARASARSSTSSATRPPAWRPTRARPPT